MRNKLLLFAAMLILCAAPVWAQSGVNLGWNDCPSGATYALTQTFACNTNAGAPHTLVGSFVAPSGIVAMSANQTVMDLQTGNATIAPWWTFGAAPACRATASLAGSFDFTTGPFTCTDYWMAGAIGSLQWGQNGANRARIRGVFALPAGDARITTLTPGTEYYSFKCNINNLKTTGLGACAGCTDEACIVLNTIIINQPAPNPPQTYINNPAVSDYAIWQAWTTVDPTQQCPAVTPTRKETWGSIKALYR
jgi:hypothetical protein